MTKVPTGGRAPTSSTRVAAEADLLLGLAQGGVAQVLVRVVLAPAGERDLARVTAQVGAPLGEHGRLSGSPSERHQHGRVLGARARPSAAASAVISASGAAPLTHVLLSGGHGRRGARGARCSRACGPRRAAPSLRGGRASSADGVVAAARPGRARARRCQLGALPAARGRPRRRPTTSSRPPTTSSASTWTVWVQRRRERGDGASCAGRRPRARRRPRGDGSPTLAEPPPRRPGERALPLDGRAASSATSARSTTAPTTSAPFLAAARSRAACPALHTTSSADGERWPSPGEPSTSDGAQRGADGGRAYPRRAGAGLVGQLIAHALADAAERGSASRHARSPPSSAGRSTSGSASRPLGSHRDVGAAPGRGQLRRARRARRT